jgi:hypothetical protein
VDVLGGVQVVVVLSLSEGCSLVVESVLVTEALLEVEVVVEALFHTQGRNYLFFLLL